ncbi:glycoside hydrolase family 114 protein, partial [Talaromyces proteolyticus]
PNLNIKVGSTWDYPLGFDLTTSNVEVSKKFYSVDLFNTEASDIAALINKGHSIVCYFSAGSYESGRPDSSKIPPSAIGSKMDGWPEKWLDTRNKGVRSVMAARIQTAKDKGCQGVDPDNIDGFNNETGFNLTQADSVDFLKFLAGKAHDAGLGFGLKNGPTMVDEVVDIAEWAINESCIEYDECDSFQPFIDSGKPVFHVEYTDSDSPSDTWKEKACGVKGFSNIIKHEDLEDWNMSC